MTDLWSCRRTTSRQTSRFSDAPELQSFGEKCGYAEKVPSFFKECLTENLIAKRQSSLTRAISIPPYSGAQDHHEGKFSMPTFTLSGFQISRDTNDDVVAINAVSLALVTPADQTTFSYTIETPSTAEDLPIVDIDAATASVRVSGTGIPGGDASLPNDDITSLGTITTSTGSHDVLSIEVRDEDGSSEELIFLIGGDPLALPTTVGGFEALEATITGLSAASGALAPGAVIDFGTLSDVAVAPDPASVIVGSDDNDDLVGTAGDDYIGTGNATPNGDTVTGSTGNDTIDMAGNDGENGFISLDYRNMAGPLTVDIDGAADTGSVVKGADGTDTLVGVAQPLSAGWTNGGLAIIGTAAGDTFNVTPEGQQWMSVRGGDGADSYNINGTGLVRLDFRDGSGVDVNLATGAIADDGFGNADTITGTNSVWEVYGSSGNDTVVMSDAGHSYRYSGGANTITGGAADDRLRYDVGQVQGIEADLGAGEVNVFTSVGNFTDTVTSIDNLRGSSGGDLMIADDSGVRLDGRDGDDTFVGGLGNDTFNGGTGSNTFVFRGGFDFIGDFKIGTDSLFIDVPGLTQADVDTAMANPIPNDGRFLVEFSPGNNVTFQGLDSAQISTITATLGDGGLSGGANLVEGTDGDDNLVGTADDDLITTGDNPGGDNVIGSAGNDTIDFTGITADPGGFVSIDYSGIGTTIDVQIDGGANTGGVVKTGVGTDSFTNVELPLLAGWTSGGLSILGTSGADSFDVSLAGEQWMSFRPGDGLDTILVGGDPSLVRLDMSDGNGIEVDLSLATGQIIDDGFGNTETIGGSAAIWEVFGSSGNDTFTGSTEGESYRYLGGNNTLDGGLGFDRLRYDTFTVASVSIDAAAGTATGTLSAGGTFTDTISGFERLRGSNGDDQITGEAGVDNRYEGRGGTDTFVHVGGNDTISDFDPSTETLVVRVAGLDQTQVDSAIAAAVPQGADTLVTFGGGTVLFSGVAPGALLGADVQFVAPGGPNLVPGTDGDDFLEGTSGDDLITTGDATPNGDFVVGSAGDDTIDMTGMNQSSSFMTMSYQDLGSAITVDIDGAANTATVDKGALGFDTLVDIENPLIAGFDLGGLGVIGTAQADTFNLAPGTDQWMQVRGGDGVDTFNIGGDGFVRLDFAFTDATVGAQMNLATGAIANDGFGNGETVTPGAVWEVRGTDLTDDITGSASNESFILRGGDDTLDGGGGFARLRYDRSGVGPIIADLGAGTVTGTWDGNGFTHSVSGIAHLRGSNNDDSLAGDTNDNQLEGRGGTDTFLHVGGDDTISDFDAGSETLIVRVAGLDQTQVDAAIDGASDTADGALVSFGAGSVLFSGRTAADLAGADVQFVDPGSVNLVPGTDNDDFLEGTPGDDLITTGDATPNGDVVVGSAGDDTIDMTGMNQSSAFMTMSYQDLGSSVTVDIDGAANTATVDKGALGFDTLVDIENPLIAGFDLGGFGVIGTAQADTFSLAPGTNQWMQVRGGDGVDTFTIGGDGVVRLDFAFTGATVGAQMNLATGAIANDGFGNAETVTPGAVWEVRGTDLTDDITGSASNESFILRGGDDTLDGGGGFDRLRYDRSGVGPIIADLGAGTVTGTWDGNGFTHSVSGIAHLRGSNGDDQIAGEAGVD